MLTNERLEKYANMIIVDLQITHDIMLEEEIVDAMVDTLSQEIKAAVTQCDFSTRCYRELKKRDNVIRFAK